jgi:SPP1 gp7 family putative phage head morphogenesis protein
MSINQELFDRQVEHSIRTRRYSEAARLELERIANRHRSRLRQLLRTSTSASLDDEYQKYARELLTSSNSSIRDLFGAEIDFQTNSLKRSVGSFYRLSAPNRDELARRLTSSPLRFRSGSAGSLFDNINGLVGKEQREVQLMIRRGIADGLSEKDLIGAVIKRTGLTEAHAKTLVATNITHAESMVKEELVAANSSLFEGFIYTAILDSRTSATCSSLDGLFQSPDNLEYRPPLHWNCRSVLVPVLKSADALKEAARVDSRVNPDAIPDDLLGDLPLKENFADWLRRQAHETQLKYLGSDEKVALLQRGNLSIRDFFSSRGTPISLARLRVLDNLATFFQPITQTNRRAALSVSRPFQLIQSKKLQRELRDLLIADSMTPAQPLSLVDFKGTTLVGKRSVRSRVNNTFDPRTHQVDPFTGEVKNTLYYSPNATVLRERIDYMRESKSLDTRQKDFIETFVDSLEGRVSINQQTAITENLRLLFERYNSDKTPWADFSTLLRNEMRYSVVNTSRILDRRSRSDAALFNGFTGDPTEPSVMILGKRVTLEELSRDKHKTQQYIRDWADSKSAGVTTRLFLGGGVPLRTFLVNKPNSPKEVTAKILNSYRLTTIRKIFYRDNPYDFYLRYGKVESVKDILKEARKKAVKDRTPTLIKLLQKVNKEGVESFFRRIIREEYRSLIEFEFIKSAFRQNAAKRALETLLPGSKSYNRVFGKIHRQIAEGMTTDYDALAISIGRTLIKEWPPFLGKPSTLQDFHREGSRILEFYRTAGLIQVNSRGVTRRAVVDMDTLRASSAWKDTVSREVVIVDPDMLQLQAANRRLILADRIGHNREANRYYVRPESKEYFDAFGNPTGISIITRSASENFDAKVIDKDFADMLNWQMAQEYTVDNQFADFMDGLVRFRDPRGNTAYYDSLNAFREEIIRRGDQGYGLMETLRYHRATDKPFTVNARIDSRGRIYYNGYLTPTGGEVVRPFLNSAKATAMTPQGLQQIRIQLAAVIGPGTEALTTAGRLEIFRRNEEAILRVGKLLTEKTQRDRRIREFLTDPFIQSIDGEEVAKVARFSLEYYRIYQHTGGQPDNLARLRTYNTQLMGEADASASGLQVIALSTGNRGAALTSNVLPTTQKQRIYDLTAQDTVADPRFQAMMQELGINLTWEDLSKAAKYQNMIALYGAGQTGQTARVALELASVLRKKEFVVTTRAEFLATRKILDQKIKEADSLGLEDLSDHLKGVRAELAELISSDRAPDFALLASAEEIHPQVYDFVQKFTNTRSPRVAPDHFKVVARILSEKLAERAPVTQTYIDFWKRVATDFARETRKVDIPWVTFDNKKFVQKYRPKVQFEVRFYDPASRRYVRNIYQGSAENGRLLGKGSIGDVRLGLAVNGNHSLDASLLRMYHLEGRRRGIFTASIHDAIFHNINELDEGTLMFFRAYQRARDFNNIKATLDAIYEAGLPKALYQRYLQEAKDLGFFDNGFTSAEILAPLPPGYDRYGIGP